MAKQLMSDYLMEMTDEGIKKEFEEHIIGCECCRKELDDLKKAEKEYDKNDNPIHLKKVNNEIKKHKRGKIIAIVCVLILTVVASIFVIGELKPESNLPSITKIKYKNEAKKIVEDFFNNDMEAILYGMVSNIVAGTDSLPYTRQACLNDMIEDYSGLLKELNEGFAYGKEYRVDNCAVIYGKDNKTVADTANLLEKRGKENDYLITMNIATDIGEFSVSIQFSGISRYWFNINAEASDISGEALKSLQEINAILNRIDLFSSGMDYNPYILNDRLLRDNYENGFVGVNGSFASSDEDPLDETYITGFNERLEEIYKNSKTKSVNMELRDYNFEKHAINVEMIWIISDLNGHEAVLTKKILYGYRGYQKLDDEANVIAEKGFDKELEKKMRDLF